MGEKASYTNKTDIGKLKEYSRRDFVKGMGIVAGSLILPNALAGCSNNGGNFLGSNEFASNPSEEYYDIGICDEYDQNGNLPGRTPGDWTDVYTAKLPTKLGGEAVTLPDHTSNATIETNIPGMYDVAIEIRSWTDNTSLEGYLFSYSGGGRKGENLDNYFESCDVIINEKRIKGYLFSPRREKDYEERREGSYSHSDMDSRFSPRIAFTNPATGRISAIHVGANNSSDYEYMTDGHSEKFDSIAKLIAQDIRTERITY